MIQAARCWSFRGCALAPELHSFCDAAKCGAHQRVRGDWTSSSARSVTADRRQTQMSTRIRLNLRGGHVR